MATLGQELSVPADGGGVGDGLLSPGSLLATCLRHHMIAASLAHRGRCVAHLPHDRSHMPHA